MIAVMGRRRGLTRLDDRVWMNREHKYRGIAADILQGQTEEMACLVVAHFSDTFNALEPGLRAQNVACEAYPSGPDPSRPWLKLRAGGPAVIALATALAGPSSPPADAPPLSLIVAERYPVRARDDALERFAAEWPAPVRLGFHLSLDEPLMRRFGGDKIAGLWSALGLQREESVSAGPVNTSIRQAQEKLARHARVDRDADSAEQWFELNLPGSGEVVPPVQAIGDPSRLPVQCPHCGGALLPSQVKWLSPRRVQCPQCGRQLKV